MAAGLGLGAGWIARGERSEPTRPSGLGQTDQGGLVTGAAGAFGMHRIIYSVPVAEPVVGLTFDDGPDPEFTPRVLETLAHYGIRATFNVMGYNAIHHQDLLNEVVAAGHELGNHTWTHKDLSTIGARETAREIRRGREVIEELTSVPVRYFRPPRGELNGAAVRIVAEEGNDILMWSITGSVRGRERPEEVTRFVLSKLEPGAIIDFHDGIGRGTFHRNLPGSRALIERRTAEIRGLPKLLETAMGQGFRFMTVSDLLTHEVVGEAPSMVADDSPDADQGEPVVSDPPDAAAAADSTTSSTA
jgi:peptidoglycan/xylan/chitin deacetylase (PgdA/CDA1 family)